MTKPMAPGRPMMKPTPAAVATAPWFFRWVQQLLRYGPPLWMGVLLPLGLLALLALLPYVVDRRREGVGRWFNRQGRWAQLLALAIIVFVLGFIVQGSLTTPGQ